MDVAVNPNDTEESIWAFLCEAQTIGPVAARAQFLKVGRDSRRVMRTAYETFEAGSGAAVIRKAAEGHENDEEGFYALLVRAVLLCRGHRSLLAMLPDPSATYTTDLFIIIIVVVFVILFVCVWLRCEC